MHEIKQNMITRRITLVGISLLLVLSLLATALPLQRASASVLAVTCSTYHTVASGETVSSIAAKYNITVAELATANDLKEPYTIYVGQRLCIPGTTAPAATETATVKGPNFTIKAEKDPSYITITTVGYPKKTPFYVRLVTGKFPDINTVKIGTIRTDKTGAATRTFKIPKNFRTLSSFNVCLKNAFTDELQCNLYVPKK
jgi:LysM repeat protein